MAFREGKEVSILLIAMWMFRDSLEMVTRWLRVVYGFAKAFLRLGGTKETIENIFFSGLFRV